ncbi:thioredoxin-dependent thiol peroxidase [Algoriphagus aestuariicola]|uniref:thioredoxin-dependent peroxiredoxin n=1 Tax=Algoriphagus aestuariicola TaxID=1852016 RepID=A0ABS3BMR6_9BACT|nr:thioredoxin-dependent thiol peroxidase [Algoriphagus aestuariicola]MBN7800607.1 thioredoxin-dependent thiol peroxidase [Algoriphagus aestuariicola]
MSLEVGQMAPDFEAKNENGEVVKLSSLRGKKVVLYFYPKDNTPTCTTQSCNLRDNHRALLKAGYVVLGVSSDSERSHRNFIKKQSLPFSLISDPEQQVQKLYGVWGEKTTFGKTYIGTIRTTFVIDEKGKITEIIQKVDSKNHTAQILK